MPFFTRPRRWRSRLAIDVGATVNLVGTLGKYLGPAALFPVPIALWYGEPVWPFIATAAITSGLGFAMERATSGAAARVNLREGFLVVSATWLLAAGFASLPYLFAGGDQLQHPVDAYFEGMSGFTTTGATVVTDYEGLSRSIDMWRQFTQWLGGMGIIVLAIAVLPRLRVGGRQLMESELPGPEVASLSERIAQTARRLWVLYAALTAAEALILASFGWLGSGRAHDRVRGAGARLHDDAYRRLLDPGAFDRAFSAASQWTIAVFMILAGTNFALLYRAFVRRRPAPFRDEEFRLYALLIVVASAVLTAQLWAMASRRARRRCGRRLSDGLHHDDDGLREHGLRALADASASVHLRAHVRGRFSRVYRRIDQGRSPSVDREDLEA